MFPSFEIIRRTAIRPRAPPLSGIACRREAGPRPGSLSTPASVALIELAFTVEPCFAPSTDAVAGVDLLQGDVGVAADGRAVFGLDLDRGAFGFLDEDRLSLDAGDRAVGRFVARAVRRRGRFRRGAAPATGLHPREGGQFAAPGPAARPSRLRRPFGPGRRRGTRRRRSGGPTRHSGRGARKRLRGRAGALPLRRGRLARSIRSPVGPIHLSSSMVLG